jgi:hypothetical protein
MDVGSMTGHRRLLFLLLKFPQNHTIFEEKTNHKGAEGRKNRRL